MMTCQELIDFIAAWLDDELPTETRLEFERHLELCPDCVDYLDGYRQAVSLSRDALVECAEEELPQDVPESLVQAVLAARRKPAS